MDSKTIDEMDRDMRRLRSLYSRNNHLSVAAMVLSATGIYLAFTGRPLECFALVAFGLVLNWWGLRLLADARRILHKWERKLP